MLNYLFKFLSLVCFHFLDFPTCLFCNWQLQLMKLVTKGEKNETKALWVLSEPVRLLMYGRADVARESWRAEGGGSYGIGWGKLAE